MASPRNQAEAPVDGRPRAISNLKSLCRRAKRREALRLYDVAGQLCARRRLSAERNSTAEGTTTMPDPVAGESSDPTVAAVRGTQTGEGGTGVLGVAPANGVIGRSVGTGGNAG